MHCMRVRLQCMRVGSQWVHQHPCSTPVPFCPPVSHPLWMLLHSFPSQGTDCFGAFMQSGLPKASLKQIWDLVAGDGSRLK